jgi:hypothetical protein
MRAGNVIAASDDGGFDAFASVAGDAFGIAHGDRHTA